MAAHLRGHMSGRMQKFFFFQPWNNNYYRDEILLFLPQLM